MVDKNRNLEIVFLDRESKYYYSLVEVESAELAKGLKEISTEIATRLQLQKDQR